MILSKKGKHREGDAAQDTIRARVLADELETLREKYVATLRVNEDLTREIQVLHATEKLITSRWQKLRSRFEAERAESARLRATCQRMAAASGFAGNEVTQELNIIEAPSRSIDLGQAMIERLTATRPRHEVVTRVKPLVPVKREMISQLLQGSNSVPVVWP